MDEVIADVEIQIEGKPHNIKMKLKDQFDLGMCKEDTIIIVLTLDGNQWTGRFGDYDGDGVVLKPIDGDGNSLYFEEYMFNSYLEEIKDEL